MLNLTIIYGWCSHLTLWIERLMLSMRHSRRLSIMRWYVHITTSTTWDWMHHWMRESIHVVKGDFWLMGKPNILRSIRLMLKRCEWLLLLLIRYLLSLLTLFVAWYKRRR